MPEEDKKTNFFIAKVAKNMTVEKCKKKVLISLDEDLNTRNNILCFICK